MPAVSLEQAVRTMLLTISNATVPDARITHGYRLQESALPAITFDVTGKSTATIAGDVYTANLRVTIIAETTIGALDIEPIVIAAMVPGGYGRTIHALTGFDRTVTEPVIGTGDEQEPATLTIETTVYWS